MQAIIKSITDKTEKLVAGVMSGTSFDGIDTAFCEITGHGGDTAVKLRHFYSKPYAPHERAALLMNSARETSSVDEVCRLNKAIGAAIGEAVAEAAGDGGINMAEVDFVSSHGQTLYHMPEIGATLQIGELADIAAKTGKPVVGDFRPSDMAYGGQGAPLVPFVDYILYRDPQKNRALFNIGGIGNVTVLTGDGGIDDVQAFDTGPGNVLIDNLMRLHTGGKENMDYRGNVAATGRQSMEFSEYMADMDTFLTAKPPKSTGRELYSISFAERLLRRGSDMGLSFPDILATVTNHTAYALWFAVNNYVNAAVDEILVSGGGVKNAYLMECLDALFPGKIKTLDECGFPAAAKEAMAFAVLGNEFLHGGFNNIKSSTGANRNVIMGKLTLPSI